MIEKTLTSIVDVLLKALSQLNSTASVLVSICIILLVAAGFVIKYMYTNIIADKEVHAAQLNKNFESLIQVHKDNSHILEKLSGNIEQNNKVTENLNNLIINKLL